jgi:putative ABC transport system permease protein
MWVFKLILRNTGRHKLRTLLTVFGLMVAVVAFTVIRTLIGSYYASADTIPPDRLVTQNAISYTFDLPLAYKEKIERVPGVKSAVYGNWFGGMYNNDPKNFFANYAVGPENYFDVYSEYVVPPEQKEAFWKEKNSCIAGQKLINRFGWKIGDPISLTSMIYPGEWNFILRGIYKGAQPGVDEASLVFRWDYFDECLKQTIPGMAGRAGWYTVKIDNADNAASISAAIDAMFKNSSAETLTQTEKAFTLNFLAQMEAIIKGMRVMSYLIIGVIMLVLVNTMAMSARERISEYALLKTLGFRPFHLIGLILGESLVLALIGCGFGIIMTYPILGAVSKMLQGFFTVIDSSGLTLALAIMFAALIGIIAALFPIFRATRLAIVDGLRSIG